MAERNIGNMLNKWELLVVVQLVQASQVTYSRFTRTTSLDWYLQFDQPDQHYLVKFPRNKRLIVTFSELNITIIKYSMFQYDRNNANAAHWRYKISWLPRFDTEWRDQSWYRHDLCIRYSIGLQAVILIILWRSMYVTHKHWFRFWCFTCEWLQRDLLNIIFGNSDIVIPHS